MYDSETNVYNDFTDLAFKDSYSEHICSFNCKNRKDKTKFLEFI